MNSLQNYQLSPDQRFSLAVKGRQDGSKYSELFLEKHLDGEWHVTHHLILTAVEVGDAVRTWTGQIRIKLTPMRIPLHSLNRSTMSAWEKIYQNNSLYCRWKPGVMRKVLTHNSHSYIHTFSIIPENGLQMFTRDPENGKITTKGILDFEEQINTSSERKPKMEGNSCLQQGRSGCCWSEGQCPPADICISVQPNSRRLFPLDSDSSDLCICLRCRRKWQGQMSYKG